MTINEILFQIKKIIFFPLFQINETSVNVVSIVILFIIVITFLQISKFLKTKILSTVLEKFGIDKGMQFTITRLVHYSIMFIGLVIGLQFVGINLSGLAVVLGFLSVGIGFGLQNITSNFIAGLILLFERPIKIGDRVTVGETEGEVMEINIRSTTISSLNNISIIVPNSEFIASRVTNWSHGDTKIRVDLPVGVSYNSDLDTVLRVLKEVGKNHPLTLKKPEPDVLLKNFGDSSWDMVLRVWILNPKGHHLFRSEINCEIVRKFRENNIEIPFPQRDLHLKSAAELTINNK